MCSFYISTGRMINKLNTVCQVFKPPKTTHLPSVPTVFPGGDPFPLQLSRWGQNGSSSGQMRSGRCSSTAAGFMARRWALPAIVGWKVVAPSTVAGNHLETHCSVFRYPPPFRRREQFSPIRSAPSCFKTACSDTGPQNLAWTTHGIRGSSSFCWYDGR